MWGTMTALSQSVRPGLVAGSSSNTSRPALWTRQESRGAVRRCSCGAGSAAVNPDYLAAAGLCLQPPPGASPTLHHRPKKHIKDDSHAGQRLPALPSCLQPVKLPHTRF